MKIALSALVLLIVATGCGSTPGYLNTDVLEPVGLVKQTAEGVKMQGSVFLEGTLTFTGSGDAARIFHSYIDAMRGAGWAPVSSDTTAAKSTARLVKDTRGLSLEVMAEQPAGQPSGVKLVIKVGGGK